MADVIAFPRISPDRQSDRSGIRDTVAVLCHGDYDLADTFLQRLWYLGYRIEPIEQLPRPRLQSARSWFELHDNE